MNQLAPQEIFEAVKEFAYSRMREASSSGQAG